MRRSASDLAGRGLDRTGLPVLLVGGGLAVGLLAQTADSTRVVLILLAASLLVGSAGLDAVPAAVLAACAAWLTVQALDRRATARDEAEAGLPLADPG